MIWKDFHLRQKLAIKINDYIYYGWIILFLSAVTTLFSSPGQTYSVSAYIDSYVKDFGFSRTTISTLYTLATILSGTLIVFMGKAVDRFGHRKMLIISGLTLAFACFFNSFTDRSVNHQSFLKAFNIQVDKILVFCSLKYAPSIETVFIT